MIGTVLDRISADDGTQPETGGALAAAVFRASLYDLILCEDAIDAETLRQWEAILRGGIVADYAITRYFRAIAEAKRRVRKPANISAYLVYRVSHGDPLDVEGLTNGDGNGPSAAEGPRCIGCSAPIDTDHRARVVARIDEGFRLEDLRTPFDCDELVGTHLSQAEVSRFTGHEVSFSYQERMIQRIFEDMESEDGIRADDA